MLKSLAWRALATAGHHAQIPALVGDHADCVLMYHSVGRPDRYGNVSPSRLRSDLEYLYRRYDVVDLPELLEDSSTGRRVAITFDDGWDDFYENAVPVLDEFDAPATVFAVSKYLGSDVMMSHEQVRSLRNEHDHITIGNHTKSHPHLSRIGDEDELRRQIEGAKRDLENEYGIEVERFAYPSGNYDERVLSIVEDTHEIAVATTPRVLDARYLESGQIRTHSLPRIQAHHSPSRVRWEMTGIASRIRSGTSAAGITSR